jgi:hypothetical protein
MTGEFEQLSRAWYGKAYMDCVRGKEPALADDVIFRAFDCQGSCRVAWYRLDVGRISPKLEIYSDSWEHLAKHPELFAELAQHSGIQPDEFCQFLKERGFRDITPEQSPYKKKEVTS